MNNRKTSWSKNQSKILKPDLIYQLDVIYKPGYHSKMVYLLIMQFQFLTPSLSVYKSIQNWFIQLKIV